MSNSTIPTVDYYIEANYAILLIVVNACSSIVACVLNFMIILTFVKTPSMRTPSYILILCLAIADFGVGILVQPVNCVELFARMKTYKSLFDISDSIRGGSSWVLGPSSLFTITAITIDRFLALHLHLRYQELVTAKRMCIVVIGVATISPFGIFAAWNYTAKIVWSSVLVALLVLSIFLMVKISLAVSKHSASIHAQEQSVQQSAVLQRYKKTANTMYFITGMFVVCYIPFTIVNFARHAAWNKAPPLIYIILHATYTLMLTNSALNPVIYCWRMKDMRNAVVQLFRNIRCHSER